MLITLQEVQAMAALLSKTPMSPAEQLWAQTILSRLFAYANQPEKLPEKEPEKDSS